jgi:hypothetical protein
MRSAATDVDGHPSQQLYEQTAQTPTRIPFAFDSAGSQYNRIRMAAALH